MPKHKAINQALALIFKGISQLKAEFSNRKFTIDGRLVGDIGEVIAALVYDLVLHEKSQPDHDAETSDGRSVQIKATFKDSLTFKTVPDYYLGFKLYEDGTYKEIYNGPGDIIFNKYLHRKGIGKELLSFPISAFIELSKLVPAEQRIPKREDC